jgi:hypothetical protein
MNMVLALLAAGFLGGGLSVISLVVVRERRTNRLGARRKARLLRRSAEAETAAG